MRTRRASTVPALLAAVGLIAAACGGAQPAATSAPTSAATSAATAQPTTAATAAPTVAAGELDADTIAKAKAEGTVVLYTSLSSSDSKKVGDAFAASAKAYGVKITVNRKSSESLVTQFMTEVKAGKVLADVLETGGLDLFQAIKAGHIDAWKAPAGASFPADLKDANGVWHAGRLGVETIAWNTSQVKAADAPKSFEDLADPKWKGKCLIEATDVEVLLGLGERKFKDMAKAQDLLTRTMANCTPSDGHTETLDKLIAGQGAVFWGAHAHSTEQKKAAGAPVDYMTTEGVVTIDGPGLVKGAAHPNAAKVFINWYLSADGGQKVLSELFRVPARPGSANEKLLPKTIYYTGPTLAEKFAAYQEFWKKTVK